MDAFLSGIVVCVDLSSVVLWNFGSGVEMRVNAMWGMWIEYGGVLAFEW